MYPFRNLAFQGGGAKALAYHGAVRVLEQERILERIERVTGTSAGATLATLLSLRIGVDEITKIYQSFDVAGFNSALSGRSPDSGPKILGRLQGNISSMSRLASRYGWYSLEFYYRWLQDALAPYCKGYPRATFAQFQGWGYRDLYIVATNVTHRRTEVFSAATTPEVAVVDALIMSQSLPLFFESLQFDGHVFGQGDRYADGGLTLNYPLPIFDERAFARSNRWFVNGVNWESLGCRLFTPQDCLDNRKPSSNLLSYVQSTFEALMEAQAVAYEMSQASRRRTININDCCVNTTDFSVRPVPEDSRYMKLVSSGEESARAFLSSYNPPLIKPLLPFSLYFDRARRGIIKWSAERRRRDIRS